MSLDCSAIAVSSLRDPTGVRYPVSEVHFALAFACRLLRLPRLFAVLDNFETKNFVSGVLNPTTFKLVKLGE